MVEQLVQKNRFGYHELVRKPSKEALKRYYADKYYQLSQGAYQKEYSDEEIRYFHNKLEQKYLVARRLLPADGSPMPALLDVGAGEGWALGFFRRHGWCCTGLDYSDHGCRAHNPECLPDLVVGDIYDNLERLREEGRCYDLIMLDNVLEHVPDPLALLVQLRPLLAAQGALVIEVPNDFSVLQGHLLERGYISRPFWVVTPDHISYFNHDGLVALCREAGWIERDVFGDYPIDLGLFNAATNYIENKAAGKPCHRARVAAENLFHDISPEKTNDLYRALAALGLGRQIIAFFQKQ